MQKKDIQEDAEEWEEGCLAWRRVAVWGTITSPPLAAPEEGSRATPEVNDDDTSGHNTGGHTPAREVRIIQMHYHYLIYHYQ